MASSGGVGSGNNDPLGPGKEYIKDRRVTELFESLTAALVHNRPDEPIDYIIQCLDRVGEVGYQNVFWDTFLPRIPTPAAKAPSTNRRPVMERNRSSVKFSEPAIKDDKTDDNKEQTPSQQHATTHLKETKPSTAVKQNDRRRPFNWAHQDQADQDGDLGRQVSQQTRGTHITDPKQLAIYKGELEDIPKLPTNTVRIFLSSTFSDFRAERNILPKEAYPELQTFCRERGLDFQVMDMRWGVTDEMLNDHQVTDLCIKEIENCQQVSCGPSFVTLLGNRYGYRPFPPVIEGKEFEILLKMCEELKLPESVLLSEWFLVDENAVPPSYLLQPIASKLMHFNDDSNKELHEADRKSWEKIYEDLHVTLRKASQFATEKGLLSEDVTAKYEISVTEQEIQQGLVKAPNVDNRVIFYSRNLNGLTNFLDRRNTGRFVDTVTPPSENQPLELDSDAQTRLNQLKAKKIPVALGKPADGEYPLEWKGVNIEESEDQSHRKYLQDFCQRFVSDMKNMINAHLQNEDGGTMDEDDIHLYHEIVHHAKFARNKLDLFCGREQSLGQVKNLLTAGSEANIPVIVHALSGHGKTSLLAKCASLIPQWIPGDTSVILRFLGTSPKCSNIRDTLLSVIGQLAALLDYTLPSDDKLDKMGEVRRYFMMLINRIGESHTDKNFVIILDSIDQLLDLYGAHRFSWLPRTLPKNVHIIISVLSDFQSVLLNCRNRITNQSNYIELEPLSTDTAEDIMHTYLALHKRTLTKDQQGVILKSFGKNAQPLYLKLVLDRALQWNSYTSLGSIQMPLDARDAIKMMFEDMKSKYGEIFVRHALSYLTCGYSGLTDIEMDDILSCDDKVLNEIYKYHDPPLEGTVRIPALLWARLGNELNEYLTEKQVDNKTVRTWYHRQFLEAAQEYYLSDRTHFQNMHSNLAQLFLQTNGIRRTIKLQQRKGKVIENADRRVAPQILAVKNLRKLNCLPNHLFKGHQFRLLTKECLLNFEFIFTKLKAVGITTLFAEFNDFVSIEELLCDPAVVLMKDFLELTYDALHLDPNLFPFFASDRLGSYVTEDEYKPLVPLVEQAKVWLKETDQPILLPTNPLNLTSLNSPVKFSKLLGYTGVVSANEEVVVCNWKEAHTNRCKITVFDLLARDTIASIDLSKETPAVITPDNRHFLIFKDMKLCMHELYTGDKVIEVNILDRKYDTVSVRSMETSQTGHYLVMVLKLGKPTGTKAGDAWKNQGTIYCLDMSTIESEPKVFSATYNPKRHIEKLIFIDNDTKLAALKRDGINIYSLPNLEEENTQRIIKGYIMGNLGSYSALQETIVGPVIHEDGSTCFVYNCKDNTIRYSPLVHSVETDDIAEQLVSFGVIPKPDMSQILFGTNSSGDTRNTRLWLWDTEGTDVKRFVLSEGIWRIATVMLVMPDWKHVIVGYQTGDISLISLTTQQNLTEIHAHGNIINTVQLYNNSQNLMTMATDHSLKLWDMKKLFADKTKQERKPDQAFGVVPLDTQEQVVEIDTNDTHAVSVSHLTKQGPRFWNLDTGMMDFDVTVAHEEIYNGVVKNISQLSGPRYHGSIELIGNFVIYQRKRRNGFFLYVAQAYGEFAPLGFNFFDESFFTLASPGLGDSDPVMFIVRDGSLEKRSLPELQLISSVEIPCITDEIPNLESKNAKRKLIYYKMGLTVDGKYFLVCNPSAAANIGKYFDLIDVEAMQYIRRIELPSTTSWKLMEDSVSFFVKEKTASEDESGYDWTGHIYRPNFMSDAGKRKSVSYSSVIYGGLYNKGLLSPDLSLGLEINRDYTIRIWETNPLTKVITLRGHTSDINSTRISQDNKFVVSGSFDNTVRLWSITKGTLLCLFHLYGNVSDVLLTPSNKYIVAKYYSAPQRTRAAVLRITNVDE